VLPRLVPSAKKKNYLTRIEVRSKGKSVSEHFFEAGRIIVGRAPDSDIYIDSHYVSRHHVQLTSSGSGCAIEDLNSTNGVLIGDEEVVKQILNDGDVISLGTHELVYADLRNTDESDKDDTSINENQA
jgi:pSer/pThr/pTyr-binding forkhead associated (FHA) protein